MTSLHCALLICRQFFAYRLSRKRWKGRRKENKKFIFPIYQAIVCETVDLDDVIPSAPRLVVARVPTCINDIRSGHISNNAGGIGMPGTNDQMREVRFLSGLSDPNVARILGVCAAEPAPWTIIEYTELGDLAHYLQYSVPLTGTLRPTCNLKTLRYDINKVNGIACAFVYALPLVNPRVISCTVL